MGKLRFPFRRLQFSQGGQGIPLPAGVAYQFRAPAFHLPFGAAAGAFIQDPVQAVCPERLCDLYALLLLPGKVVKGKGPGQDIIQLLNGFVLYFFSGKEPAYMGAYVHLPLLQAVIQGIPGKGSLRFYKKHRYPHLFQQQPHAPGQGRGPAVKGIAGLRVHKHAAPAFFQGVGHIRQQSKVCNELLRGDAAHLLHQIPFAHKTVPGAYGAVGPVLEYFRDHQQIDPAGVVHQDQAGARLFRRQGIAGIGKVGLLQILSGRCPHEQPEQKSRPFGHMVPGGGAGP